MMNRNMMSAAKRAYGLDVTPGIVESLCDRVSQVWYIQKSYPHILWSVKVQLCFIPFM